MKKSTKYTKNEFIKILNDIEQDDLVDGTKIENLSWSI